MQVVLAILGPVLSAVAFIVIQAARGGNKAAKWDALLSEVKDLKADVMGAKALAAITRDNLFEFKTEVAREYVSDRIFTREIGQLRAEINGIDEKLGGLGEKIDRAVSDIIAAGGLRALQGGRNAG